MQVLLVDDEKLNLENLQEIAAKLLPGAEMAAYSKASQALDFIQEHPVDIAFLDIEMRGTNGITIAEILRLHNPKVNVIFCTGHSEYSLEAWNLDCSGYLLKPITEDKVRHALGNLRYPIPDQKRVRFQCFGNFEVYCDGVPIAFKYSRTKEFLAYLVDRNGASCSLKELSGVLFEDEEHRSYIYQIRLDLVNTLTALGGGRHSAPCPGEDRHLQGKGVLRLLRLLKRRSPAAGAGIHDPVQLRRADLRLPVLQLLRRAGQWQTEFSFRSPWRCGGRCSAPFFWCSSG